MIKQKKKCSTGISVVFGMNQVVDLLLKVVTDRKFAIYNKGRCKALCEKALTHPQA